MSPAVAGVAELADARDSKSRSARSVGSIPTAGSFQIEASREFPGIAFLMDSVQLMSSNRAELVRGARWMHGGTGESGYCTAMRQRLAVPNG